MDLILKSVKETLLHVSQGRHVTLIAVSKLQSIDLIEEAYHYGHRDFGENYVQELLDKSKALKNVCPEIRWHFIGTLQSNKISSLLKGRNDGLVGIESVDSLSKLEKIFKVIIASEMNNSTSSSCSLELFLQFNISGEESKQGMKTLEELIEAYNYYVALKPSLSSCNCKLSGLMVIGEPEHSLRDFANVLKLREELVFRTGWIDCKLSMGMSADYELAAQMGADVVRVGTAIFGARKIK